jgi:hypothetical protein
MLAEGRRFALDELRDHVLQLLHGEAESLHFELLVLRHELGWHVGDRVVHRRCNRAFAFLELSQCQPWNGDGKVVTALLKAGASAKAALPNGGTAFSLAKSKGHREIVAVLEKA